uniref:CSON003294 protein n=1 Tax=Culicoides sonorensis TaxID=179676 RepID=A0A336MQN9_CULSO
MIVFLQMYHSQFINPEFERESRQLFPKFSNSLFFKVCDMKKFMLVTLILSSFYLLEALIDLNERNFANSLSKFTFSIVLLICYRQRLENYSVLLNIYVGLYSITVHLTHLIALNISPKRDLFLKLIVIIRLLSWIFIYLNILPFDFLIPTVNASANKASVELNLLIWGWYVVRVWTSPFLKYFYHEIYHLNGDCVGDQSVYKCILVEDTPEQKHLRTMRRIFMELKFMQQQKSLEKTLRSEETSSAKTFQTIKCIMALKRKLRRIRARGGPSNINDKVPDDSDTEDDEHKFVKT